ncbi:MAG: hypothetical protein IPI08_03330, partial [Betaproteobacteria bacterium]|nr:hypothetical protein [Betaproteobacteria bacterium]
MMPLPVEDIEMQALSLPPEDRARLERLIASFSRSLHPKQRGCSSLNAGARTYGPGYPPWSQATKRSHVSERDWPRTIGYTQTPKPSWVMPLFTTPSTRVSQLLEAFLAELSECATFSPRTKVAGRMLITAFACTTSIASPYTVVYEEDQR